MIRVTSKSDKNSLPSDSEVIGAVNRNVPKDTIVIGAAGSMPGELHKLWQSGDVEGYHMEYGFSCMGYEIPAAIGVNLAEPDRPNVIFVGDGSYMMMNSELSTAVMMGISTTIIVTDNRGFGCINRLQKSTGSEPFNNLFRDSHHQKLPNIDYVLHAKSLGANAEKANSIEELDFLIRNTENMDCSFPKFKVFNLSLSILPLLVIGKTSIFSINASSSVSLTSPFVITPMRAATGSTSPG